MDLMKIFEEIKKSKVFFSSFEILVPNAKLEDLEKNYCMKKETPLGIIYTTKNKFTDVKEIFTLLRKNYERECGDLEIHGDSDLIYLLAINTLNNGKPTNDYKYIGFLEVYQDIIQVVWLHPFLRGKGMMTSFLIGYGENENILTFQPPFSKSMQMCMNKVESIKGNDDKFKEKQSVFIKKFLKKYSNMKEIDDLTINEIYKVFEGLTMLSEREDLHDKINYKILIEFSVKSLIFLRKYPEGVGDLKNAVTSL